MDLRLRTMYTEPDSDSTYSSVSFFGQTILENEKETALKCLDEILDQRVAGDVITLADYGTSDGGNVVSFMNHMIDRIQDIKGTNQEINIILEDQCFNDFNALFRTVKGYKGQTAIKESDNVHLLVSGTSMYNRCLPNDSVDFGVSTIAVHWLSNWPVNLKSGISCFDADKDEIKLIYQQGAKDWKTFVMNRGKEMKPGAYFLVQSPADSEKKASAHSELNLTIKEMVKDKIITMDEFYNINLPCDATRSLEDFLHVFSEPEVQDLNLKLVSYKKFDTVVLDPIPEALVDNSSVAEHARTLRIHFETWYCNIIIHGLSKDRDQQQKLEIKEEVFKRFQKHLVNTKWTKGMKYGAAIMLFRKNLQ